MGSQEYPKIAEYFVVAGLTETSQQLDDDLAFTSTNVKLGDHRKDPITDICIINRTHGESCPQGFTCIEKTPVGYTADLDHGSLISHSMFLCYKRGKDKPPLIELGVFYETLEVVKSGVTIITNTPAGRSANVNHKNGLGNHSIYLTYRRAKESAPQNSLVVTDICIILSSKGERAPYAFCVVDKNLNKGLIGSSVHLCYKKSMRQVDSISYKAGIIDRYPRENEGTFPLPVTVPLFCLPMGATVECWSSKTKHPFPVVSSFVLTTETSEKIFGTVVSFYESYPEEKLTNDMKYKLGLLRGDGIPTQTTKSIHTNKALCLLSRWPMFTNFRDFLIYLYRMTVSPKPHAVPVERYIAHFLHKIPFPSSQRPRVQYQMSAFSQTVFTRPQITPIPLSGASFLALLDDMGPDNAITLLVLALTEQKIVIHSLRPAEITRVAEALITLMFPFKWQCTYVPLCPLEMGYVMEAPCPFIVGVDSRYFDLFEPPSDVACVNLDMKSITLMDDELRQVTWKLLPKKPVKVLRSALQRYFVELTKCPREESLGFTSSVSDPDLKRTERHAALERAIQEAVLKMMAVSMKGYRQYLLPITAAPNEGTTDPNSLFNIQEFIRSRDKSSHRFFTMLSGTQVFSSFIEERSLTSVISGGEVAAGRSSSLVFFDECIDRLIPEYESVQLIESDDTMKSEHTVMIMAPEESGLPPGVEFQYTTFPLLQDELFVLDGEEHDDTAVARVSVRSRRASDTFTFGRRTKQELKTMQKLASRYSNDPQQWARLLLSHTYGAWFACLPAFVMECRHKSAALRTAHDALYNLEEKDCFPLPDETFYRMLLHLCSTYNKPALAMRVFQFIRKRGIQLSAITYGLYNKAVLEGTWPSSKNDGYMLWRKLRNVLIAVVQFRQRLRTSDTTSRVSVDSYQASNGARSWKEGSAASTPRLRNTHSVKKEGESENSSGPAAASYDHGYNSMPKDDVRRGSPVRNHASPCINQSSMDGKGTHKRTHSSGTETTTDSVISSTDANDTPKSINLERNPSIRSIQPPNTLDIPPSSEVETTDGAFTSDLGMRSDDTLVNGETESDVPPVIEDYFPSHRPRATHLSPLDRRPDRSWSKTLGGGDGGSFYGCKDSPSLYFGSFGGDHLESVLIDSSQLNCVQSSAFYELACNNHDSADFKETLADQLIRTKLIGSRVYHMPCPLTNGFVSAGVLSSLADFDINESAPGSDACEVAAARALVPSIAENNVLNEKNSSAHIPLSETEKENRPKIRSFTDVPKSLNSPSTPEIVSKFKEDSKFFSSFSYSDQRRYQELCSRDNDPTRHNRSGDHSSQLPSFYMKYRSSSSLSGSGRISPLVSQKPVFNKSNQTPTSPRRNFDHLTAENITSSSTRSISPGRFGGRTSGSCPTKVRSLSESPNRIPSKRTTGGIISLGEDGVPVLTSTPMQPLIEPVDTNQHEAVPSIPPICVESPEDKRRTPSSKPSLKKDVMREDISYLSEDPLSPVAKSPSTPPFAGPAVNLDPLSLFAAMNEKKANSLNSKSKSLNRHLVDEILKQDSIVRSSSDATLLQEQRSRLGKSSEDILTENSTVTRKRKSSLPSRSPQLQRKPRPAPLQRSMTYQDNINTQPSNNWLSSGKKFNNLLKSTVEMANKAKKVAKGLNETMQANFDYYLPEKIKGSLSDLSMRGSQEDLLSKASSEISYGKQKVDRGSQNSLRSADSAEIGHDVKSNTLDRVPRRVGGKHNPHKLDRPLSVPYMGASSNRLPSLSGSSLLISEVNVDSSSDLNIAASSSSLNAKVVRDIEVTISSCSLCSACNSFVYDEDIMAGWFADDSNLNTHCPFCNSLFVPFLDIEITDHRASVVPQFPPLPHRPTSPPKPEVATYEGSFTLASSLNPVLDRPPHSPTLEPASPTSLSPKFPVIDFAKGDGLHVDKALVESLKTKATFSSTSFERLQDTEKNEPTPIQSESPPPSPRCLEPITVPYLSSLVLRKELESLLENEGTIVLTQPHFVDHHPIIYWNLVWYFRRLNLRSNLYDLVVKSELLRSGAKLFPDDASSSKCQVTIYLMWDNLKLHRNAVKPSMYLAWLHMVEGAEPDDEFAYSVTFLDDIVNSVQTGDVRGPLVAVLNELNAQQRGGDRRSAYREILYLALVALEKDINAFDRQYKKAYNALTTSELELIHKSDRPPTPHAAEARKMFGELALIK